MTDFPYAGRFPVNRGLPERGRPREEVLAELRAMAADGRTVWIHESAAVMLDVNTGEIAVFWVCASLAVPPFKPRTTPPCLPHF